MQIATVLARLSFPLCQKSFHILLRLFLPTVCARPRTRELRDPVLTQ